MPGDLVGRLVSGRPGGAPALLIIRMFARGFFPVVAALSLRIAIDHRWAA